MRATTRHVRRNLAVLMIGALATAGAVSLPTAAHAAPTEYVQKDRKSVV